MSVDIGKIAVTFAANTEGFTRGVGSATSSLMGFVKKSQEAGEALSGAFTANFGGTLDALTAKLDSAALSGEAFGESIAGAFSKAAKSIDAGFSGSFDTLAKEMQVGLTTGEEFAQVFGELSGRASSGIDSIAQQSLASLNAALEDSKMAANEFGNAVVQVAAGSAGAGIDQTRDASQALGTALQEAAINGQEFLALQRELSSSTAADSMRRHDEAVAALREQFDLARLSADEFTENLRGVQTAFRIEAAAEFETQIADIAKAWKSGAISTEEFNQTQKILEATLQRRFVEQLQDQLSKLPELYEAAGRSAEELASAQEEVNKKIEAGKAAADRIAKKADKKARESSGGDAGHGGGIMGGLEKAGKALSIIPGEIGHAGHMMESIVSVSGAASKALSGLGGSFAALANPMSLIIGASIAAGGAMLKLVNNFGAAAQESQKLATQFGLTLREVAVLQAVLKGSGSSMGEFQNVTRSLQRILGTAAEGGAKASVVFRRLGLDAKEIRFSDSSDQVREVVTALAKVENPAERASLAIQVLGRNGAQFAAKFGTDVHEIEHSFEHAEQAVQRFKTAFSEFDSKQLIKANRDIGGIAEASEGLAGSIAAALAPLAAGLGSAVADTLGTITNIIVGLSPPIKLVGAVIGEVLRVIGSFANSLARVFAAGMADVWITLDAVFKSFSGGVGIIEAVQAAGAGLVRIFEAVANYAEAGATQMEAWSTGRTIEEMEAIKRSQKEMAELGEAAANVQEKYGDKTESIKEKLAQIAKLRSMMGSDGKPLITAEEAAAAVNDLNEQLKKASPYVAMMNAETERFENEMKTASKQAADMGNNIAQGARAKYFEGYKALLDQLKNNEITKELFDESVKGLADKFNREMEKAKPIKVISDQIEELAKKYNQKSGAAAVMEDFGKFQEARDAGGTFVGGVNAARMQRINEFGSGLGLDLTPKLDGFALYQSRMDEINKLHRESAKTTTNALEEEKKFNQLRAETTKQLLDEINKAVKAIGARKEGPMEKFVKDAQTLNAEYNKAKAAANAAAAKGDAVGLAEANRTMKDISERRFRNVNEMGRAYQYEGSGEKAVREFNEQLADIGRARGDLAKAGMMNTPEMDALSNAEKDAREKFRLENIDAIDRSIFGSNKDTRAATGIDATSQEGVSTYFRVMREDHSVTKRQLEEARQSRILLQKLYEKPGVNAAGL